MQLTIGRLMCVPVLGLVLGGLVFAQSTEQPAAPVIEASTNCFATFAIGTLTYCVSEHGNVARFTSPAIGPEHIRLGVIREGYAVCAGNAVGAPQAISFDSANAEAGWQAAVTIVQPNGANTLPLCITRRTFGNLELQQCFSHNANEREVVITMTLRNVSGATRFNVMMDRYFDGDIGGDAGDDRYTRSADAVWGEDGIHTLVLADINGLAFPHTPAVHTFVGFLANSCNQPSVATPTALGDFVGRLSYRFGDLAANASRSIRVQYRKL